MGEGIQGQTPKHPGGRVSELVGHQAVRNLVKGYRDQDREGGYEELPGYI
jgi:hypothetical protein